MYYCLFVLLQHLHKTMRNHVTRVFDDNWRFKKDSLIDAAVVFI